MSRNALLVDGILAVGIAAVVLIFAPGLAVAVVLALIVLVACAASVLIDLRGRRGRRTRRRIR